MIRKKKDKFMERLEDMIFNLDRAAIEFGKMDFNTHLDLRAYADNIKTYESHGDDLMHQVITDLNQTFITPIEREDIMSLCNAIDDVLDAMEETSGMFEMYSIEYTDEYMLEFVDNIQKAIGEMKLAIGLMTEKKLSHMRVHSINIKEYETNCDGILRQSIKHIFNSETDPVTLIKIKDIYESLENIADRCQAVANNFETIIMKNS
ncbi:hypothetical protein RN70_10730 [Staphylococcus schleiferi]|uniref:DUF47 domain-containing protein n=2 Tax=Staphylococcus TaxID=1279 RepID=A0A9X1DTZ7_9STAP|nr:MULTISPECIES: DUF47 domain-containing protein [Staphylococcus]QGS46885.1 DUF47 family protein [Mammaliicoccus fleurettii]AKS67763.1 hypothetical protein LH95_09970 [Staphylococcus schleiferi]AKS69933.1 hypothetical protein NP71_10455 [Staphylococcus schleiferi]AKS72052.1 hypothetical protein OA96_09720 [Staphylococcus schleiferi]AKS74339.1 hypothetical protein RN70_10730 [Staphylococcus schleiferi]